MTLVYLDTETTGLDPSRHHVWEIAWAVDDGPIRSSFISHNLIGAHPQALEVGRYWERLTGGPTQGCVAWDAEMELRSALAGATIIGANPAFDAAFLSARWGEAPWLYRLFDIESYAVAFLPPERTEKVPGLKDIAAFLRESGHEIPVPDHTAAGDVAVRAAAGEWIG